MKKSALVATLVSFVLSVSVSVGVPMWAQELGAQDAQRGEVIGAVEVVRVQSSGRQLEVYSVTLVGERLEGEDVDGYPITLDKEDGVWSGWFRGLVVTSASAEALSATQTRVTVVSPGREDRYVITIDDEGNVAARQTPRDGRRLPVLLSHDGRTFHIEQTELTSDDGRRYVPRRDYLGGYALSTTGALTPARAATDEPVLFFLLYVIGTGDTVYTLASTAGALPSRAR